MAKIPFRADDYGWDAKLGARTPFIRLVEALIKKGASETEAWSTIAASDRDLLFFHDAWHNAVADNKRSHLPRELWERWKAVQKMRDEHFAEYQVDNAPTAALNEWDVLVDDLYERLRSAAENPMKVARVDVEQMVRQKFPDLWVRAMATPVEPKPKITTLTTPWREKTIIGA